MKKLNFSDKLKLDKETIADLNEDQLRELEGGVAAAGAVSCTSGITSCFTNNGSEKEAIA